MVSVLVRASMLKITVARPERRGWGRL